MQNDNPETQAPRQVLETEKVYGKSVTWLIGWILFGILLTVPLWVARDSLMAIFWLPAAVVGAVIIFRTVLGFFGSKIILQDKAVIFSGGTLFKTTEDVPYSHISGIDMDEFWGTISVSMTDGGRETYSGLKDYKDLKDQLKSRISETSYNTDHQKTFNIEESQQAKDLGYLERLQVLRQNGALTEDEFQKEKHKFLNRS